MSLHLSYSGGNKVWKQHSLYGSVTVTPPERCHPSHVGSDSVSLPHAADMRLTPPSKGNAASAAAFGSAVTVNGI